MKFIKKEADRKVDQAEQLAGAARVIEAVRDGVAVADLSHWGILRLTGADRLSFLNGLCTAKLVGAAPGDAIQACFVNKVPAAAASGEGAARRAEGPAQPKRHGIPARPRARRRKHPRGWLAGRVGG
jgi:hypothetical protein